MAADPLARSSAAMTLLKMGLYLSSSEMNLENLWYFRIMEWIDLYFWHTCNSIVVGIVEICHFDNL